MAIDVTVAVPLPDPKLKVRVIALLKAKQPGAFEYLQGMRQGTLTAISANPEETEVARAYHRKEQGYFTMLAQAVPAELMS